MLKRSDLEEICTLNTDNRVITDVRMDCFCCSLWQSWPWRAIVHTVPSLWKCGKNTQWLGPHACLWTRQSIIIIRMHFIDYCQWKIELGNRCPSRLYTRCNLYNCNIYVNLNLLSLINVLSHYILLLHLILHYKLAVVLTPMVLNFPMIIK